MLRYILNLLLISVNWKVSMLVFSIINKMFGLTYLIRSYINSLSELLIVTIATSEFSSLSSFAAFGHIISKVWFLCWHSLLANLFLPFFFFKGLLIYVSAEVSKFLAAESKLAAILKALHRQWLKQWAGTEQKMS